VLILARRALCLLAVAGAAVFLVPPAIEFYGLVFHAITDRYQGVSCCR
jgi:hypothetical protein